MSSVEELVNFLVRETRILLVEDNYGVAASFKIRLTRKFVCNIEWADTGEKAVQLLNEGRAYDIIFLDLLLPGMSGVDVLRVIKEKQPFVPVIVMSGFVGGELWKQATALGVVGGISKPFHDIDFDELFRTYKVRTRLVSDNVYFNGSSSQPSVVSAC